MNGNHATFEGNLTKDIEVKHSVRGTAYANFSLARSFKRGDTEETTFLDCVAFGQQAENLAESAAKGTRLMVEGYLNQSRWETTDGQKRSKIELVADTVSVVLRWATALVEKNERPTPDPEPVLTLIEGEMAATGVEPAAGAELVPVNL